MALIRTERGLDRLVNFSDATVAIAITLLILPLVDDATKIGTESFGQFFSANFWELFAFGISFAVIARFWVVHHRIFESVAQYSVSMLWFNFIWLFAIVMIPFTANLLSNGRGERADVYALYIGNMLLATVATLLIGVVLLRHPELMTDTARADVDKTRGIAEVTIMALALVLAVLFPAIWMYWLFLLFLSGPSHALLRRAAYGPSQKTG
jgi:uncharacterized membrane protein